MADPGTDANDVRVANDAFYKALSAGSIEDISAAMPTDRRLPEIATVK
ncbi:hypothetical protein [Microvirga sp. VF16]|nr:hypothetical protein [Microvirga sp. VF16]QRM31389.1 hypothetical protein JO965_10605 [Microvirga sp. VF16]